MISVINTIPLQSSKIANAQCKVRRLYDYSEKSIYRPINRFIDIKARGKYPFNYLSNFSATNFILDGVKIKSMEGFLQSLKMSDPVKQREMCLLDGFEAKKMSKSIKRADKDMILYWNGKTFLKGSEDYKNFKKAVIEASESGKDGFFYFDGKKISSVGAFLTAIKVESPEIQDLILTMSQENLRQVSKNITPRYKIRDLYWNGEVIRRDSKEYQNLLDRAYNARYCADSNFRNALKAARGYMLVHTKGKRDISETILTQDEFVQRLNLLRDKDSNKYKLLDTILFPYYKMLGYLKNSNN